MQASSLISLIGLACMVMVTVFWTFRHLHNRGLRGDTGQAADIGAGPPIHVCFCSDDTDLRPLAVAITSVHANAHEPHRLRFHLVTTPELERIFLELLTSHLPKEVNLEVHANEKVLRKIRDMLTWRASSKVSRDMSSIFNFAPYFLHEFFGGGRMIGAGIQRMIYLDTDIVMLGDVGKLAGINLRNTPFAAVRTCQHRAFEYIDFELLKEYPAAEVQVHPKDCLLSRAVMVVDLHKWRASNITGRMKMWLQRYKDQALTEDLWYQSMSVPPWILSVDKGVVDAGSEWSCGELGGEENTRDETADLIKFGLLREDLNALAGMTIGRTGNLAPGIHRCTAKAKLLHFGGTLKPWILDSLPSQLQPLCVLPQAPPPSPRGWTREGERETSLHCKDLRLSNCSSLWWAFLTAEADCGLKDYLKEWRDGLHGERKLLPPTAPPKPEDHFNIDPFFHVRRFEPPVDDDEALNGE
eukprot:TRINITY_DN92307_c0_g1_i1.p1 TRINITY_DN92307_c0_g1~~TRINITY_DN92307_c0_g1_i1.p1  ORF type:complete len:469 (+),score=100.72 TRINITY_DN92307_c0_g1_i1:109-1515(+)